MADQSKDNPPNKPPVERRDPLATIGRGVVPPVLQDAHSREQVGVPADEDAYGDYMIELNIQYSGGLRAAAIAFRSLYETVLESVEPGAVSGEERPVAAVLIDEGVTATILAPGQAAAVRPLGSGEDAWDVVDETATHLVRELVLAHPEEVTPVIRTWAEADDL